MVPVTVLYSTITLKSLTPLRKHVDVVWPANEFSIIAGGQRAIQARNEVNAMPINQLNGEEFSATYWEIKDANPDMDDRAVAEQARGVLAEKAAKAAIMDPTALGTDLAAAVLGGYAGGAGGILGKFGKVGTPSTRLGGAAQGAVIEGGTEMAQGAATQYGVNTAIQGTADGIRRLDKEVLAASLNEGILGAGPGIVGGMFNEN